MLIKLKSYVVCCVLTVASLLIEKVGEGVWQYFWHTFIQCTNQKYSRNHIDILVQDTIRGNCKLTIFYDHPEGPRRRTSWNLKCNLSKSSNLPWCILRYFSDIL